MNLIEEAYTELFPEDGFDYIPILKYSAKFSNYNANIKLVRNFRDNQTMITLNLSRKWEGVSREIQKGLIQSLLVKMFKRNRKTVAIDLYNLFIKNLHISLPKEHIDPELEKSFHRVNDRYFNGLLEIPNLLWGELSFRKLATYNYAEDKITFSTVLRKADNDVIDYIMYHELLHKKLKYKSEGIRDQHHTGEFKRQEHLFENYEQIDKKIKSLLMRRKFLGFLGI